MANYYELTKSVRITTSGPVDGDRYIAADIAARDALITKNRAHEGLQVYVLDSDGAGKPQLYILETLGTVASSVWSTISTKDGVKTFIELTDTPDDWTTASDGSIVTVDTTGAETKLKFTDALSAFNKDFGTTTEMAGGSTPTGTPAKANSAGDASTDKVAKIDHHHDGRYYDKDAVDDKLAAVNAGIKYIWDDKSEIESEKPAAGYKDGEQGLLKDASTGDAQGNTVCGGGTWADQTVYQYNATDTCWKELYTIGGNDTGYANLVQTHDGPDNPASIIVSEAIGQYSAGEKISSSDNVYNILKKILEKVLPPTIKSAASIGMNFSGVARAVEVGTDLAGTANPSVSRGTVSSYDPNSLPDKVDVIQVGALDAAQSAIASAVGGYTIAGLGVTGEAVFGTNSIVISAGTAVEAAPIHSSDGQVYTSPSIPRSITRSQKITVIGRSQVAYGTKFSTGSATPTFPNDRTTVMAETGKRLMDSTMSAISTALSQNTDPAGFTWIFVTLKGTLTAEQARAKVRVYDTDTNDQLFDVGTLQVATFSMNDAGSGTMPYTTVYRNAGNWTANKNVTITIL